MLFLITSLSNAKVYDPKDLKSTPLKPVRKLKFIKKVLPNGIKLFIYEDHTLPIFEFSGFFKAGYLYLPYRKGHIPSASMKMMEIGGTESQSPEIIEDWFERNAAGIRFWGDSELCGFDGNCLIEHRTQLLIFFKEILLKPRFDEKRFDIFKKQQIESIIRNRDRPSWLAHVAFNKLMYGKDTIWGWKPTEDDFKSLSREDLVSWHKKWVTPGNMYIAIAGDFNAEEVSREVEKLFDSWNESPPDFPQIEKVREDYPAGIYLLPKEVEQASIVMGHFGVKRWSDKKIQISMFNQIFGYDGFASVLIQVVRNELGYAYAVWGGIGEGIDKGLFRTVCYTKPSSVINAIDAMIKVINDMQLNTPSDTTMSVFKEKMQNQWAFRYENSMSVLKQEMIREFFKRPENEDEMDLEAFMKVKPDEVKAVAGDLINTNKLLIVVVGPKELESHLAKYGKVNIINIEN